MRINKDNIYVIPPSSKYFDNVKLDSYMEGNFTLHVRCKINVEMLPENEDAFIISRNGMHSGIAVYRHSNGEVFVHFIYWFLDNQGKSVLECVNYLIPKPLLNFSNTYTMICNHSKELINCYINEEKIGSINYIGLNKCSYKGSYYWFGCSNMLTKEGDSKNIGDFDIDLAFLCKNSLKMEEVEDIALNYRTKYSEKYIKELRLLNNKIPQKEYFGFFCDFSTISNYKIWNMSFNGIYPMIYLEDNTYY